MEVRKNSTKTRVRGLNKEALRSRRKKQVVEKIAASLNRENKAHNVLPAAILSEQAIALRRLRSFYHHRARSSSSIADSRCTILRFVLFHSIYQCNNDPCTTCAQRMPY